MSPFGCERKPTIPPNPIVATGTNAEDCDGATIEPMRATTEIAPIAIITMFVVLMAALDSKKPYRPGKERKSGGRVSWVCG